MILIRTLLPDTIGSYRRLLASSIPDFELVVVVVVLLLLGIPL